MKLMLVLMLAALPLYCYAGSGCQLFQDIVSDTISSAVPMEEFQESIKEFVHSQATKNAMGELKQCFLNQSNETLANAQKLMDKIYSSPECSLF
ncbi:mammaglobin-A-like [Sciurus carolinensis]|uniref:mammaglobin-A-like n=1 Tax=Sciurus carolinensis TaxID=30640 RepID=UPI001FB53DBB|nr:mammaglobin-A-like [Sciurus carolinensis]